MSSDSKISFSISTSDSAVAIGISVWIDETCLYQVDHLVEPKQFEHNLPKDEGDHELRIVMTGKTTDHTQIDELGNIVKDVVIHLSNVLIDNTAITQLFIDKCVYTHNFNGTQSQVQEKFYGSAGCNGVISFKFTTPAYQWLLENM